MDGASATSWRSTASAIPPGRTATFRLRRDGRDVSAFIVNYEGTYYAYVNRCPHAGSLLDWWPNEFLTEDGRHLVCATHGAIFAPDTGRCVEGPCPGARLDSLPVERRGESLIVGRPE